MKKVIYVSIFLIILLFVLTGCNKKNEVEDRDKIVTSFYPLYIMTLNITDGIDEITVKNMTSQTVGCLHNYTLQMTDLKNVDNAKVFIKNGFGLENFMDKIMSMYPNLKIIDTSNSNVETIMDEEEENGHVWTNIENYKKQVRYITESLCEIYPEYKEKMKSNMQEYLNKINKISKYELRNETYVISCSESLSYILNDAKLKYLEIETDHDENGLSSNKLAEAISYAREHNVKVIFIDKNDDKRNADLIAKETGAKVVSLDSALSGEMNKDEYIKIMNENFEKLKEYLENNI